MKEPKYIISISFKRENDKKNIKGVFQYSDNNNNLITYEFSPLSVLCDLSIFDFSNYNDNENIYTGYSNERALNNIKIDKHKDTYYYSLAQLIKNQILNKKLFTIKDIEKLKLYFDIKLNYSISYLDKNNGLKPLQYSYCKIDNIIDKDIRKTEHTYIYNCFTLTDVLFSILHYLIYNDYNHIENCNHCNRLYFYNNKKILYCDRNSPYSGYTNLKCEQAVRNIKQYFSRIHKRIYNNFYNYKEENLNEYLDKYYIYKEKIDECSSIKNLKEMDKYLKSVYKKN